MTHVSIAVATVLSVKMSEVIINTGLFYETLREWREGSYVFVIRNISGVVHRR
ncbi:MAG: hypothetical protein V7K92_06435 [Nostoc sp.]